MATVHMTDKTNMYSAFCEYTASELYELLIQAPSREEALLYQRLHSLKLALAQERVVGEELL